MTQQHAEQQQAEEQRQCLLQHMALNAERDYAELLPPQQMPALPLEAALQPSIWPFQQRLTLSGWQWQCRQYFSGGA